MVGKWSVDGRSVGGRYANLVLWPTALKLGCVANFDMLFLVMRFTGLVSEIKCVRVSNQSSIRSKNDVVLLEHLVLMESSILWSCLLRVNLFKITCSKH